MANLKKYLWPKKRSRKILMVCLYVALVYLVLGGFGIVPLVAQSSGFFTPTVASVQGYNAGTDQLSYSGLYNFAGSGQSWQGGIKVGNARLVSDTDLGVQQVGYQAMMIHQLQYQFSVMMYTLTPWSSRVPGITSAQVGAYAFQYFHLGWDGMPLMLNGFSVPALSIPSNAYALTDQILQADVGISMQLDPTIIGQNIVGVIPDSAGTGNYTLTSFYAAVLNCNANPTVGTYTGLLTEPGTYVGTNMSKPAGDGSSYTGSGTGATVAAKGITSAIQGALDTVGPSGHEFDVTATTSVAHEAGAIETSMGLGDPATLTLGPLVNYNQVLLNDSSRCNMIAHVPFQLRPVTTIYQTQYAYNSYKVHDGGLFGGPYVQDYTLGQTLTVYSAISVHDVVAIQPMIANVLVAYNYTWNPLNPADGYPDIVPPLINGTDNGWNTDPTSGFAQAGGAGNTLMDAFLSFFGPFIWVLVAALVIVVMWALWRFTNLFGKKKR